MRRATTQKSTGEFFYVALECIDGFIQREIHFVLLFAVYYSKHDRLSDWLLRRRVHCTQQASLTTHLVPRPTGGCCHLANYTAWSNSHCLSTLKLYWQQLQPFLHNVAKMKHTGWRIKKWTIHFIACNITTQILKFSTTYLQYLKHWPKCCSMFTLRCNNWRQLFPKLSD